MTFYRDEIARLTKALYPHDDLTKQIIDSKVYIDKHYSEDINLDKIVFIIRAKNEFAEELYFLPVLPLGFYLVVP